MNVSSVPASFWFVEIALHRLCVQVEHITYEADGVVVLGVDATTGDQICALRFATDGSHLVISRVDDPLRYRRVSAADLDPNHLSVEVARLIW
jgi:hypothetical protein